LHLAAKKKKALMWKKNSTLFGNGRRRRPLQSHIDLFYSPMLAELPEFFSLPGRKMWIW